MESASADINWPVIIIVGIIVLTLLIFILKRNKKDKKELEQTIKHVDEKPLSHESNEETKI
jgi:LPXTG-motif cell wall-anchored protein